MQKEFLKRFVPYFKILASYKLSFGGGVICGVINGALTGLGMPVMIYKVYPIIFADPTPAMPILVGAIALFPVVMVLRGFTSYFSIYLLNYSGIQLLIKIRMQVQEKLQEVPLEFYDRNTNGDLFSRVMTDTQHFQIYLIAVAIDLIKQPVQLIGALSVLVYLSMQQQQILFLLLFISVIPAVVVPLRYIGKRLLKRTAQLQDEGGNIAHIVSENINAAREVRAFNLQERELSRFSKVLDSFCHLTMKTVKYSNIMRPSIEVVSAFGIAGAVTYLVASDIQYKEVIALFFAFYATYEPLKKVSEVYNKLKQAEACMDRMEYISKEEDTLPDPENPDTLGAVKGDIQLSNIRFRYLEDWVLSDVSLNIAAGSTVAMVGPSGAGKSTLADLIPRFYDVNEGSISIDGKDIRNVTKEELRNAISVVSQDTFLFNATIEENIRMGRLDATSEEIRDAAKHAFAHDFIEELEAGYETVVGDRGTRLSGGQKQRIAIARAFLKASPILILDEATSALDSESEEMIQRSIEELVQGRTVIVIAHRFSTIRNADKIVVLESGKMVGYGSHDELYPANEVYKRLYDRQFSE